MTQQQANVIKIGTTVSTTKLPPGERHAGKVIETNGFALKIKWDDGIVSLFKFDDDELGLVDIGAPKKSKSK